MAASLLILGAVPAASVGAPTPANPEVDQYFEDLPGPEGEEGINRDRGNDGSGGGSVPGPTVNELNSLGAEGAATAELARATAPGGVKQAGAVQTGDDDGSAVSGVLGALTGGVLLSILLAATLGLTIAYLLMRRRLSS